MKFENVNIKVVPSSAAKEVFVTNSEPYMNFVIHLPANAQIESGSYSVTFTANPSPPAEKAKPE
jgi:hypothetical protein